MTIYGQGRIVDGYAVLATWTAAGEGTIHQVYYYSDGERRDFFGPHTPEQVMIIDRTIEALLAQGWLLSEQYNIKMYIRPGSPLVALVAETEAE